MEKEKLKQELKRLYEVFKDTSDPEIRNSLCVITTLLAALETGETAVNLLAEQAACFSASMLRAMHANRQ